MATYTATFTLDATDDGNLSNYSMFTDTTYTTNNGMNNGSLVDDMNAMQFGLDSFYGGTSTYTLSGNGTYLSATTVTWTIVDPTFIPSFVYVVTENFYYPMTFVNTSAVCEGAYELTLTACEDNYTIPAGLTPSSLYYFSIETNRGKRYVQHVSTNGSGDVQLWSAAPEFPVGFFTPEMFTYTCKAYTDSNLTSQVQFTIDNVVYNTINLNFIYTIIVSD